MNNRYLDFFINELNNRTQAVSDYQLNMIFSKFLQTVPLKERTLFKCFRHILKLAYIETKMNKKFVLDLHGNNSNFLKNIKRCGINSLKDILYSIKEIAYSIKAVICSLLEILIAPIIVLVYLINVRVFGNILSYPYYIFVWFKKIRSESKIDIPPAVNADIEKLIDEHGKNLIIT